MTSAGVAQPSVPARTRQRSVDRRSVTEVSMVVQDSSSLSFLNSRVRRSARGQGVAAPFLLFGGRPRRFGGGVAWLGRWLGDKGGMAAEAVAGALDHRGDGVVQRAVKAGAEATTGSPKTSSRSAKPWFHVSCEALCRHVFVTNGERAFFAAGFDGWSAEDRTAIRGSMSRRTGWRHSG